jgi:hypothetical protein
MTYVMLSTLNGWSAVNTRALIKISLTLAVAFIGLSTSFIFLGPGSTSQDLPENSGWILVVDGSTANPLNFTYEEILAMPKTTVYAELYCVDRPDVFLTRGRWSGVRLGFLLEKAQVGSDAIKVAFYASDGYSSDLPLTTATREDVIVAYELNGQPLSETLRLVVPGKWGYKWVSQLIRVEPVDYDFKGTWESAGYSDEANSSHTLPPDLNKDGSVNIQDLEIVAAAFGTTVGNSNPWNNLADMDNNGTVNIIDVCIVAKSYGKTA